jgi:hypothetical protein
VDVATVELQAVAVVATVHVGSRPMSPLPHELATVLPWSRSNKYSMTVKWRWEGPTSGSFRSEFCR